ncbi:PREDICTED: EF-hand calcium-binding domain-containing protein 10 isoform X2 [Mandrillus leucophaeus]|nr:PREDICTED: EF-hand calcium-binding domain-containing protein 10 isoform X2 [Mandrillus leucophaeus]
MLSTRNSRSGSQPQGSQRRHVTAPGRGRRSRTAGTPGSHLATAGREPMETSNRELQAAEYLERHQIKELVSYLTSALLFFRPALKTLGLCTEDEDLKDDGHIITLDKFKEEVNKRMKEIWSAF